MNEDNIKETIDDVDALTAHFEPLAKERRIMSRAEAVRILMQLQSIEARDGHPDINAALEMAIGHLVKRHRDVCRNKAKRRAHGRGGEGGREVSDNIELKLCPICGAEFERSHSNQRYCSKKCYKKAWKQNKAEKRQHIKKAGHMLADAHQCVRIVDNETIMRSRRKPKGVSDVRWRMELRRRLNPEKYAYAETV